MCSHRNTSLRELLLHHQLCVYAVSSLRRELVDYGVVIIRFVMRMRISSKLFVLNRDSYFYLLKLFSESPLSPLMLRPSRTTCNTLHLTTYKVYQGLDVQGNSMT
jgi:hypothetical protein